MREETLPHVIAFADSETAPVCSPMKPLFRILSVLRALGGFPLTPRDAHGMRWKLNKVSWGFSLAWMTMLLAVFVLVEVFVSEILRASGVEIYKFISVAFKNGFTYTDIVIASLTYSSIIVVTYAYVLMLFTVYNLTVEISYLSMELSSICAALRITESQLEASGRLVISRFLRNYAINCCMIITFFMCIIIAHIQLNIPVSLESKVLGSAIFLLTTIWFGWSFVNCALYLICSQLFSVLCMQLEKFHQLLRSSTAEDMHQAVSRPIVPIRLSSSTCSILQTRDKGAVLSDFLTRSEITSIGKRLARKLFMFLCLSSYVLNSLLVLYTSRIVATFNANFGFVIATTVGGCLFFQINGTFGTFHTIESLLADDFNFIKFLVGIPHILMALLGYYRVRMLFRSGESAAIGYTNVKAALEDYLLANLPTLTIFDVGELQVLIDEFSDRSPIRPKRAFAMTSVSALHVTGLFVTYILVLLHFKLIESETNFAS